MVAAKTTEAKASATAIVYAKNKTVLFEGLIADAEEFLVNNFPRVHSAEADPDFTVVTTPKTAKVKLPPGHPDPAAVTDDE